MAKYYFKSEDDERCFLKKNILNEMKENGILLLTVYPAIREINSEFFYCNEYGEFGMKGECGKSCKSYEPRNGKSGCCKHRAFCYEPEGTGFILNIFGQLRTIKK